MVAWASNFGKLNTKLSIIFSIFYLVYMFLSRSHGDDPCHDDNKKEVAASPRILCFVLLKPDKLEEGRALQQTWGARCDKLVVFSSQQDGELNTVQAEITGLNDGKFGWASAKESWKYVYDHYKQEADWFIKVEEDTFVAVQNLKEFLRNKDPTGLHYFGALMKHENLTGGYNYAGSGYVLSKEALRRFVLYSLPSKERCRQENDGYEDSELARCLANIQVKPGNTLDGKGRKRFMLSNIGTHVSPLSEKLNRAFFHEQWKPEKPGFDCCSDLPITFHDVSAKQMYVMEFFFYRVRLQT